MKTPALLILVLLFSTCGPSDQDMFQARRLTFEPAQQGFPTWSPDSRLIIFQYTDLNDTTGRNGLWKITPDGKGAEHIFKGIAEHAQWSPDGRFVVFDADTGKSIKIIPFESGIANSLLPETIHINKGGLPCWSPDASRIAFKDSQYALCIYNIQTGQINRIFRNEGMLLLPGC
jgi:Tol biopolymer transport system component